MSGPLSSQDLRQASPHVWHIQTSTEEWDAWRGGYVREEYFPETGLLATCPTWLKLLLLCWQLPALGVWACCGAELGPNAVLDRLGQVRPKVLIAADGYLYKGREFEILPSVAKVVDGVPSIEKVVVV